MPRRRNRSRLILSGVALASVVALCALPLSARADGVADGECRLGDTQFLPGEPGWSQSLSQICGGNFTWNTEATYYWTDEKLVIYEPRALAFDYSAFGGLDPFATEYSVRKANELFPDTSHLTDAYAKAAYAQSALTAKARTLESRKGVTPADACSVLPPLFTDAEIRSGDAWLAPAPKPGGPTGHYTYELAPSLTAEQRSAVLDALTQFDAARGPNMPELVQRAPGDTDPPTITFADGSKDPEMDDDTGGAFLDTADTGRDGLRRWVTGTIELTNDLDWLNAGVVGHEIAHVYQYTDTPGAGPMATMSTAAAGQGVGSRNAWKLDKAAPPGGVKAFDACLKAAFAKR